MAFFSFCLLKESFLYLSKQIEPNQKYYSKDIALCKELNNRNKKIKFCYLNQEKRLRITTLGKKLLLCLPPKFGLGDAIEYGVAIKSLIKSKKFSKIGVAFCDNYSYIFNSIFSFVDTYPLLISEKHLKEYDTVFHITLEIEALRFQKYKRSNIALEICKYFDVQMINFKIKNNQKIQNFKKTISIFPVSTSVIRSLPYTVIDEIIKNFNKEYEFRVIIDNSSFSKHLEEKNKKNNFLFVKPKNIESLFLEVSRINFGIFIDSGPLHIAKMYNKFGILIETSVQSEILLTNSKNIYSVSNLYKSNYCQGPCNLVDIFAYDKQIGCYETNETSFKKIKTLKSFKNLQRWNKQDSNSHFFLNPVGCVKKINVKNIIELINTKMKDC